MLGKWILKQGLASREASHKLTFSKTLVNCSKIVICLPREQLRVPRNSLKCVCTFQIELEFGSVGFKERRKLSTDTQRKSSHSKGENQQQTEPTYGIAIACLKNCIQVYSVLQCLI